MKYRTEPEGYMLRIIALKDFSNVKKGDRGGLIGKESNLSQYGDCWVYENAKVSGSAYVTDNAKIYGHAWVYGNAIVSGNAEVDGDVCVYGEAKICGGAWIGGKAEIRGDVKLWSTENLFIYTFSVKNSKDYVIFGNNRREFHIYSSKIYTTTTLNVAARDYIKNIQTIRQIYLTPNF